MYDGKGSDGKGSTQGRHDGTKDVRAWCVTQGLCARVDEWWGSVEGRNGKNSI
ncbi:hypothetical protein U1Q18_000572, partial [Sarracenia purpurea var. burkii]